MPPNIRTIFTANYGKKKNIPLLFWYLYQHPNDFKNIRTISKRTEINGIPIGNGHEKLRKILNSSNRSSPDQRILDNYITLLNYLGLNFTGFTDTKENQDNEITNKYNELINIINLKQQNNNINNLKNNIINLYNYIITNHKYPPTLIKTNIHNKARNPIYEFIHDILDSKILMKYSCLTQDENNLLYQFCWCINKRYSNKPLK